MIEFLGRFWKGFVRILHRFCTFLLFFCIPPRPLESHMEMQGRSPAPAVGTGGKEDSEGFSSEDQNASGVAAISLLAVAAAIQFFGIPLPTLELTPDGWVFSLAKITSGTL